MINQHPLEPCQICDHRMAVPGWPVCTMCDAFGLAAMVPDFPPDPPYGEAA